jgi:hypothetical protein
VSVKTLPLRSGADLARLAKHISPEYAPERVAKRLADGMSDAVKGDLGYFDLETRVLEPFENPFGPKVLPM